NLDKPMFKGIAWVGGTKWIGQLLTWASNLIVARLLTPGDFGVVSMATVYLGLLTVASEFGIGSAVITIRELSVEQLEQLHGLAIILGLIGFGVSLVAARPLELFFRTPQLSGVVIALSLSFIITSFQVVPAAYLQRELRFKQLSLIGMGRTFVSSSSVIL